MNISAHAIRSLLLAVLLIAPAVSHAKSTRHGRKADVLTTLKTGQWIRIEGVLNKDHTVQCREIKILTGDFLDDDWAITGQIDEIDARTRRLTIGAMAIQVAEDAVVEGQKGRIVPLSEIRRGMIVEVDGTYLKNRTFLAGDVDDESDEISYPAGEQHLRIVARVEATDPGRRRLHAMGMVFVLTDATQVKSVIR